MDHLTAKELARTAKNRANTLLKRAKREISLTVKDRLMSEVARQQAEAIRWELVAKQHRP